ncbi:arsenate reductase ArsC [Azospirillum sp. TSO22-1]|uniref:arsenate reductase ArsC n=1 Tax=Azospirillum sp. TSO22-1 TaxID=716789 RepID=UPI000D61CA8A|nr:arsenate reductase ArsC [Azospirillum sp. TSO22-1]PWC44317.1 ArsR family transcriptional regulator [Azospirillum sp. TSO22-1]
MTQPTHTVLFLCTHNSARSVMAESVLNRLGRGRFRAFSAGSRPAGHVDPDVLALLARLHHPVEALRSKSWDEFAGPDAPELDFVFTVCDTLAGGDCPVWPGQPMTAHWGFPDPAAFAGPPAERAALIADIYRQIERRLEIFVSLPMRSLDRLTLQTRLDAIGGATAPAG